MLLLSASKHSGYPVAEVKTKATGCGWTSGARQSAVVPGGVVSPCRCNDLQFAEADTSAVILKHICIRNLLFRTTTRVQELCESRGGRPWAPFPNEPYGFGGCNAALNHAYALVTVCP